MASILRIIAVGGLAGLAALGCGPSFEWVGKWEGFRPYTVKPGDDPSVARTASTIRLTVSADGTYDLTDAGIPSSGEFQSSGKSATLKPTRIAGVPADRVGGDIRAGANLEAIGASIRYSGGLDTAPVELKRLADPAR